MYCISPLTYIPFFNGLNKSNNKSENSNNPTNSAIFLYCSIVFSKNLYFGSAYFKCSNTMPNIMKLNLHT